MKLTNILRRIFIIAFLASLASVNLEGNEIFDDIFSQRWRWIKYNRSYGLPSNKINAIIETPGEVIWALSSSGIAYFDGYSWSENKSYGIDFNKVNFYHPSYNTGVILVTSDNEMFTVKNDTIIKKELYFKNEKVKIHDAVETGKNRYIVTGISKDGKNADLYLVKGNFVEKFMIDFSIDFSKSTKFITDSKRNVLLQANNKLYLFKNDGFEKFYDGGADYSTTSFMVMVDENTILFDVMSKIYTSELKAYNFTEGTIINHTYLPFIKILSLYVTEDKKAIAMYSDNKLRQMDLLNGGIKEIDIPPFIDVLYYVVKTSNNDIWLGTDDGLYVFNTDSELWNYLIDEETDYNSINAIIRRADSSIAVGSTGGLTIYGKDGRKQKFASLEGTTISSITGLVADDDDDIWISSGSGFTGAFKFKDNKWQKFGIEQGLPENHFHKLVKNHKGEIWFLPISINPNDTSNQIVYLKNNEFKKYKNPLLHKRRIYDFAERRDGRKYFATDNGLIKIGNNDTVLYDRLDNLYNNKEVFTLSLDSNDNVWFGGRHKLCGMIDSKDSVIIPIAVKEYNIENVWNIQIDNQNRVWIATQFGLYCIIDDVAVHFNKVNGLNFNKLWPLMFKDNKLYAGSLGNGINILDLSGRLHSKLKMVNESLLTAHDEMIVKWNIFGLMSPTTPSEFFIRHKINGEDWSSWMKNGTITLSGLSEGHHKFFIQAMDNFGNYKSNIDSLEFTVTLPFVKTKFFYALLALLIVITLLGMYYFTMYRLKLKANRIIENKNKQIIKINQILEQKNNEITNMNKDLIELNSLKSRVYSVVAHDMKNPLTSLMLNLDFLKRNADNLRSDVANDKITRSLDTLRLLNHLSDNVLKWSSSHDKESFFNPIMLEVSSLVEEVIELYKNESENKRISFVNEFNRGIYIQADKNMLESIIRNILSNAIKYSYPDSEIIINIKQEMGLTVINISDSGIGMRSEEIHNILSMNLPKSKLGTSKEQGSGFGLMITLDFIKKHRGNLNIHSEIGKGSTFEISLPVLQPESTFSRS